MSNDENSGGNQQDLGALLTGGDWACALGNADVLAEVARTLFPSVSASLQYELGEITRLAYRDFSSASARWMQLSAHLRALLMMSSHDFGKLQA